MYCRFRSTALHRIRFGTCCFVPLSYFYSEIDGWSKDWVKQWAQLWSATTFCQFHQKFYFTWKKKVTRRCSKFTNIYIHFNQNFDSQSQSQSLVKLSQYCKSGSTFSSSEPVAARSDCRRLGNALPVCLCSPVRPAKAVPERCPKSLALDFAAKTFDCLWEWLPDALQGLEQSRTWILLPDQRFYLLKNPRIICV